MSSIGQSEAASFSTPAISDGITLACRPRSDFFRALPFFPIDGHEYRALVVSANCDSGLSSYAGALQTGAALNTNMPSITEETFGFARFAKEVPLDSLLAEQYSSRHDLTAQVTKLGVEAVRDAFKQLAITGDTANAGEFDGLRIIGNSHSYGANNNNANGGTVLVRDVYELLDLLDSRSNPRNTFLVGNQGALSHLRANNFSDLEYVNDPQWGLLPVVAGVPYLIDNFIPRNETKGTGTNLTSIYALVLDGKKGVFGAYPMANEGQPIQVRGPVVNSGGDTQYLHVSASLALVATDRSVARLDGVAYQS